MNDKTTHDKLPINNNLSEETEKFLKRLDEMEKKGIIEKPKYNDVRFNHKII